MNWWIVGTASCAGVLVYLIHRSRREARTVRRGPQSRHRRLYHLFERGQDDYFEDRYGDDDRDDLHLYAQFPGRRQ